MKATENDNILDFINDMKSLINEINVMRSQFKITDTAYMGILAQVLSDTWDAMIDRIARDQNIDNDDPDSSVLKFQCLIKDEYFCRMGGNSTNGQQSQVVVTKKKSLAKCITQGTSSLFCNNCKKKNHKMDDCRHLQKQLCTNCNQFRHTTADCWWDKNNNNNNKHKCDSNDNTKNFKKEERPSKKGKAKEANIAEEEESAVMYGRYVSVY